MNDIKHAFEHFMFKLTESIPDIILVILVLIFGFLLAKLLKRLTVSFIKKTGVDDKLKESNFKLSRLFGKLIYFVFMIFVFIIALNLLGLSNVLMPLNDLLSEFIGFIPNLIGAGLVGYIGYMLATIASEFVGLSGEAIRRLAPKINLPENLNLISILKKVVFIFIFVPLLIAALNILNLDTVSVPATNMLESFFEAIPKVLFATLILILFIAGGRFLSNLVKDLLDSLNLNEFAKRAYLSSLFGSTNIESVISSLVYIFIVLFGIVTAIERLEFNALTEIVNNVVNLSGNILFGLVILAVGNWIANIASVTFSKTSNNLFVASVIKIAILSVFLAIGLQTMGIADSIINLAFGITLGTVALTIVLSFGLGGREAASKQMQRILDKFNSKKE